MLARAWKGLALATIGAVAYAVAVVWPAYEMLSGAPLREPSQAVAPPAPRSEVVAYRSVPGASISAPPPALRPSRAVGLPFDGRLENGRRLPSEGTDFLTWDPVRDSSPDRPWRRWGTERLVRTILSVVAAHRAAHPGAPRVVVGDLSRPTGGDFGARYGPPGHASHQNGLDVDVYYPRLDRVERAPASPEQIDRRLAQDLTDRFLRAGAQIVFVGPRTGLRGPEGAVEILASHHDDHMHVRLRPGPGDRVPRGREPEPSGPAPSRR